jgi:two-component system NtrC family sensor kinase
LTAGIVHELNNPLAGIMGFAQISLKSDELSPQVREDLETILHASQRCHNIVHGLLEFSSKKVPKKEPVSLYSLLEPVLHLVRYDFFKSGINIICECPDSLPLLFADTSQIEQVFLNIITNARQAMEKSKTGTLTIQACQETDKIIISFKDNGCGIAKEHLSKIFEPFFTTKPAEQGTGLGLPISYRIIQEHGGTIVVKSQEGAGTTFTIELPAYVSAAGRG